jgi:putative GTP pyrophosphokinase
MDCWAALEHELKYKQTIPNQELLQKELKRCSDEMASTDLTMQTIRQIIDANENIGKDERMEI